MAADTGAAKNYDDLQQLFVDWREFERPPLLDGAPDYTAPTFEARYGDFAGFQARLQAFDISDWPIEQQVDWHIVRAELKRMIQDLSGNIVSIIA